MTNKIQLGKFGEKIAAEYLINKGYKVLTKNYYTPNGEIDLICQKNHTIFFVEVKTRTNQAFGWPEEAIDDKKLEKIVMACQKYLQDNNLKTDWQIDAISLIYDQELQTIELKHLSGLDIN